MCMSEHVSVYVATVISDKNVMLLQCHSSYMGDLWVALKLARFSGTTDLLCN